MLKVENYSDCLRAYLNIITLRLYSTINIKKEKNKYCMFCSYTFNEGKKIHKIIKCCSVINDVVGWCYKYIHM